MTLNLKDVCGRLDISVTTGRRYIKAGILPMRKLNGRNSTYKIGEARFQKWFDEEFSEEIFLNEII